MARLLLERVAIGRRHRHRGGADVDHRHLPQIAHVRARRALVVAQPEPAEVAVEAARAEHAQAEPAVARVRDRAVDPPLPPAPPTPRPPPPSTLTTPSASTR